MGSGSEQNAAVLVMPSDFEGNVEFRWDDKIFSPVSRNGGLGWVSACRRLLVPGKDTRQVSGKPDKADESWECTFGYPY